MKIAVTGAGGVGKNFRGRLAEEPAENIPPCNKEWQILIP
jgi:malate/lactate dehydrogenase